MRRKALRGRKGKRPGQRARTREVKVGAVFTHRRPQNEEQRPERDYQSTSYIAEISSAQEFGAALRAEALRRGMGWAKVVVFWAMAPPGSGRWHASISPVQSISWTSIMPPSI